jgi:hypothetical protein
MAMRMVVVGVVDVLPGVGGHLLEQPVEVARSVAKPAYFSRVRSSM